MMTPEQLVLAAILVCIGGAVIVLLASRSKTVAGWLTFMITVASGTLVGAAVAKVLLAGPSNASGIFWSLPKVGFALRLHVDGLTAVFL